MMRIWRTECVGKINTYDCLMCVKLWLQPEYLFEGIILL